MKVTKLSAHTEIYNPPTLSACWSLPDYSLEIKIVLPSQDILQSIWHFCATRLGQPSRVLHFLLFWAAPKSSVGGGWGEWNQFWHASDCYRHAKITYPASSSHHQTYFRFVVTPPRRLKMPPSRLQNASKTPWRRWKIELKSFIYASAMLTPPFDSCFINCNRFYAHSTYKNHGKT